MPTLSIAPFPYHQFFDANGNPLAGGQIFTYEAGTTTKLAAYTESTGTTPHTNPIVLDSAGRPPSPIYLSPRNYKFVAALAGDTDPPTSPIWTVDPVPATSSFDSDLDISGVAGQTISIGDWVYNSQGDGGRTAGRWYPTDADLDYASTTARIVGFALSAASAAGSFTIRRAGRVTGLSGLTAGLLYYLSGTAAAITSTAPANTRRVAQADSTTSVILSPEIEEPIKGFIELDLLSVREVAANVFQNAAANGGLLASDTTPAIERVNAATDKAIRIRWVAANVDEITWSFPYPPDLDGNNNVEVHMLAAMAGAADTPVIGVGYFEGVGDTNAGGNTAAITGITVAEYSVTVTAANIGSHPNFASISLIPAAHGTDALYVYAIWVEYIRLLKST